MSTRREESKPQTNKQLVTLSKAEQEPRVNQRQEKKEKIIKYGSLFRCDNGWSARNYLFGLLPHSKGQALDESKQFAIKFKFEITEK